MASAGEQAISMICGGFCLVIFSGLTAFCGTKTYGAGSGSGRSAGCCGSCCRASFDEDAFEAEVKKDLEKTRDPNAQPTPKAQMEPTRRAPEEDELKNDPIVMPTPAHAMGTS